MAHPDYSKLDRAIHAAIEAQPRGFAALLNDQDIAAHIKRARSRKWGGEAMPSAHALRNRLQRLRSCDLIACIKGTWRAIAEYTEPARQTRRVLPKGVARDVPITVDQLRAVGIEPAWEHRLTPQAMTRYIANVSPLYTERKWTIPEAALAASIISLWFADVLQSKRMVYESVRKRYVMWPNGENRAALQAVASDTWIDRRFANQIAALDNWCGYLQLGPGFMRRTLDALRLQIPSAADAGEPYDDHYHSEADDDKAREG